MKSLNEVTFQELSEYLYSNNVFGFTASRRKNSIIYASKRYYIGLGLSLKVKVMRKTKYVMSVMCKDKVYTDFEELKKLVEKK
jgi:hypothetical protein